MDTTRTHAMPAKAASGVRVVSCRVSDRACAVVPTNVAQIETYDWLAYACDLNAQRSMRPVDAPISWHARTRDGRRYFMRLAFQIETLR